MSHEQVFEWAHDAQIQAGLGKSFRIETSYVNSKEVDGFLQSVEGSDEPLFVTAYLGADKTDMAGTYTHNIIEFKHTGQIEVQPIDSRTQFYDLTTNFSYRVSSGAPIVVNNSFYTISVVREVE